MEFDVDFFNVPIFNFPKTGLRTVMDNKFTMQKAREALTKSHNILTLDNVQTIFASEYCTEREANGFRNRVAFAIGLALAIGLCYMDASQFKLEKDSRVYYPKIGSGIGEPKNAKGGIRVVSYRNRHILIHDITFFGGSFNIYQLISKWFEARRRANRTCTRSFLGVKPGRKENIVEYFRNQPLGGSSCSKIAKEVCQKLDLRGNGRLAV